MFKEKYLKIGGSNIQVQVVEIDDILHVQSDGGHIYYYCPRPLEYQRIFRKENKIGTINNITIVNAEYIYKIDDPLIDLYDVRRYPTACLISSTDEFIKYLKGEFPTGERAFVPFHGFTNCDQELLILVDANCLMAISELTISHPRIMTRYCYLASGGKDAPADTNKRWSLQRLFHAFKNLLH